MSSIMELYVGGFMVVLSVGCVLWFRNYRHRVSTRRRLRTLQRIGLGVDRTLFAGLARAALELAIDHTKERKQGGVPIIQHQSVRGWLFEMYRKVEAARSLNRDVVLSNALNAPRLEYAIR